MLIDKSHLVSLYVFKFYLNTIIYKNQYIVPLIEMNEKVMLAPDLKYKQNARYCNYDQNREVKMHHVQMINLL